eukprot:TRINITY_DN2370_c0_g1_i1.p2 TRINITY_DN2370_c0_g1~~TRINITY_DN2370_c0_g1_i1.p2  ORF type:complete len:516 (+),score=131.80 TRINITY_DN2370_c0_g1_i1:384-1931(+)
MADLDESAAFLKESNVPGLINEMLLHLLAKRPDNPVAELRSFLQTVDESKYGAAVKPKESEGAKEGDSKEVADIDELPELDDPAEDLFEIEEEGDLPGAIDKALADGKTKFDISKKGLVELPHNLKNEPRVTALSVEENQIGGLEDIMTMSNLTYLNMSDNPKFKDLPEGFGTSLKNLVKIDAFKCSFVGELSNELSKMENLTYINFYNNGILKPPAGIGKLKNLTELNLSSNKIMALKDDAFTDLQKLRRLALFWNRVIKLPSLAPLTSLRELQLNGNQLPEMPELGVHKFLEEINLSENQMTTLHKSLFDQPNLQAFSAGKNKLTDASILNCWPLLTTIKKIQMPNNLLTCIPECFLDLPHLIVLELNSNQITSIPDDIDRLEKKKEPLNHLFLVDNKIPSLPPAFGNLKGIKRIALKGNPLDMSETTRQAYESLEAIVAAKGKDGKFIDDKRNGPPRKQVSNTPSTLGAGGGLAPAGGGGGGGGLAPGGSPSKREGVPPSNVEAGGVSLKVG